MAGQGIGAHGRLDTVGKGKVRDVGCMLARKSWREVW